MILVLLLCLTGLNSARFEPGSGTTRFFNESCLPDSLEIEGKCMADCQNAYFECYFACNGDNDCMRHCTYEAEDCYNVCPCHLDCPAGCPCDHYECPTCEDEHEIEVLYCAQMCFNQLDECNHNCEMDDLDCLHECTNIVYKDCRLQCPCNKIDSKPETTIPPTTITTTSSPELPELPDMDLDGVVFAVNPVYLEQMGFVKYYDKLASAPLIKPSIYPPCSNCDVFIGCSHIDNPKIQLGAVATKDQFFEQQYHGHGHVFDARPIKDFYVYHDTGSWEPLGFAMNQKIFLNNADFYDCYVIQQDANCPTFQMDSTRLSTRTTYEGGNLWRCGSDTNNNVENFYETYKMVMYYRQ